jgi:hypothetical protein
LQAAEKVGATVTVRNNRIKEGMFLNLSSVNNPVDESKLLRHMAKAPFSAARQEA